MAGKLADWVPLAEIVSGIAVVISLVFLALGIKENTEITRADVYDRNVESLNAWRMHLSSSAELTRLYQALLFDEAEDLSLDEQYRLLLVVNQLWGIYEKSYYANQYGTLGDSEWTRFNRQTCLLRSRMQQFRDELQDNAVGLLTEEFVSHVDETCGVSPLWTDRLRR